MTWIEIAVVLLLSIEGARLYRCLWHAVTEPIRTDPTEEPWAPEITFAPLAERRRH